jgi:hypothetical protein
MNVGAVKCWGHDRNGGLGRGYLLPAPAIAVTPADVCERYDARRGVCERSLMGVTAVSAGYAHTCAVTETGRAMCWGENVSGQLGNGCHVPEYPFPPVRDGHPTPGDVLGSGKSPPGDASHNYAVTSIDAQLVLQFDAGLILGLPCPSSADFDADRRLSAIDASLILQRSAGLI